MKEYNALNERIKREYFEWKKYADGKADRTIDEIRKHIYKYEAYTRYKSFSTFSKHQAVGFKDKLVAEKVSLSTKRSISNNLIDFFKWLAGQKDYKSKIMFTDIEYLKISKKESRISQSTKIKKVPTLEQIQYVIKSMPRNNVIQMRNRALFAFTSLSGMRDSAIASLRIRHVDVERELIKQYPDDGVDTKAGKTIETWFFPVGEEIKKIVIDWILFLKQEMLWDEGCPLFPRAKQSLDSNSEFQYEEIEPMPWSTANPIRKIFKEAFENAGIDYYNPHAFRNMLVRLGEKVCQTPEEFKAWSQNLGHEHVLTTFCSYGHVDINRQGEIIKKLNNPKQEDNKIDRILSLLEQKGGV